MTVSDDPKASQCRSLTVHVRRPGLVAPYRIDTRLTCGSRCAGPYACFASTETLWGPPCGGRRKLGAMPLSGEYAPSPSDWAREQADKYAESGGTDAADMKGMPIILLTTVGAKTGKLRKTPLTRVEHDGQYAVVASLGGAPKNPVWYHNIVKNPRVELQDGSVTHDYDAARSATRRRPGGNGAVAAYPDYADDQEKTERQFPVFVPTPVQ